MVRRRGFEVLLRKLLAYKHAPALIVLHWWSPRTKHFWESAQDEMDVFNKCAPRALRSLRKLCTRDGEWGGMHYPAPLEQR